MSCTIFATTSNGFKMPALGFGTWQSLDEELEAALDTALTVGYRHIDTAYVYNNEHVVGRVLKKWIDSGKIDRKDLFIVTKLPNTANRAEDVDKLFNQQLKSLQLDYLDLYLIHSPFGFNVVNGKQELDMATDLLAIWKEMEKLSDSGKVKAIGVSNFNEKQVQRILDHCRIKPVTNQVELHLYNQQPGLVKFLKQNDITVTAYSPLGNMSIVDSFRQRGINKDIQPLIYNPVVKIIAGEVGKTAAQVLLRHLVQKNLAAIPKSTNPGRIKENFTIFDFQLSEAQMEQLDKENQDFRILTFLELWDGVDKHPEYPF